jgi:L-amino acid N-acyltransferase YncA
MRQRINTITNANLPYLVAILKKTPSKPTPGYVSEKLVGWINLDEYCSRTSLYRYTFEMELFVHPGHRSKGIGKCLMDKLLEMADGSYRVRGGYEYVNNYEYLKNGPGRVIKTILVNCHHENSEDADKEWQGKFLNFCKFHRVGRLTTVGYKNGKVVDVSIYAHHTKEDINPNVPPA